MFAALALATALSAPPHPLKWDARIDVPVTSALVLAWGLSEFALKDTLAPATCRWCATNDLDVGVRRAFNPTLTPSTSGLRGPATASDLTAFVATPLAVLGLGALGALESSDFLGTWLVDILLILEATMAAQVVTQVVKFSVGRLRPYGVDAPPELLAEGRDPRDVNLSFPSGHATFATGLAVSAGVVALLRGYRHAWLTWAVALPLAVATGVLRMAADKHWLTDVLTGTLVTAGISAALPLLFHGRGEARLGPLTARLAPGPSGVAVVGTF